TLWPVRVRGSVAGRTIRPGLETVETVLNALVIAIGVANSVLLIVLAALAWRRWRLRRDVAARWVALAFASITLISTVGRLVPAHPHGFLEVAVQRLDIELLV